MRILILVMMMAMSPLSLADDWPPSHDCYKPYKPYQFSDQWEVDQFRDEVRQFQQCIQEFVEEQEEAIENHQQAAEDAVDEWNSFVNLELN